MLRRADGTEYPAEMCMQLFAEENPPVLVAIVHDTTERRLLADSAGADGKGE